MIEWFKGAWRWTAKKVRAAWPWLKWTLAVAGALVAWNILKARLSRLVGTTEAPTKWAKIPNDDNHVLAKNPTTGDMEIVELPTGVKADEVRSVGISKTGETYEVERLHTPSFGPDRSGGG